MSPTGEHRPHRALRLVLVAQAVVGVGVAFGLVAGAWMRGHSHTRGLEGEAVRREGRLEWTPIDRKHWQATLAGETHELPEVTDAREKTGAGCPAGMVRVRGLARVDRPGRPGEIERLQNAACTDWISRDFPARCRTFDAAAFAKEAAKLPVQPMDYCIDRFEYPNIMGENPWIVVTFREAETLCRRANKRLCSETEWTFACEGEDARPYPYGFQRDATACVVDRDWRPFKEGAFSPRDGETAREEVERLWQAEPSGSRGGCRSPFGVYDMTGNVDEWTRSVRSTGYASVLKGGYWGPVRARCRPATRAHNEDFVAYQQSFRCCGASDTSVPAPASNAPVVRAPTAAPPPRVSTLDAGASTSADLAGGGGPADEGDEIEALRRARVGLACRVGPASRDVHAGLGAAALACAALASRRRRRPC